MEYNSNIEMNSPVPPALKIKSYMQVKDVAEYLQISVRIAYKLIKEWHIKHTKIGEKIIRVHIDDVDEYMSNNQAN